MKGGEWGHVSVVKEPAKHGMAWHVKCSHCGKVFQGNAMRIRSHLLGHPEKVSGCPACPPEAREELRLSHLAKSQVERKKRPLKTSRPSSYRTHPGDPPHDSIAMVFQAGGLQANFVTLSPIKPMVQSAGDVVDLEFFLDGFGIRAETISKIKEMGFTGKTFMSNVDELLALLESIKQQCHLTLGEEWGIKGAAKKWLKEHGIVNSQPELEKWPDPETKAAPGCKEEILNLPEG